MSIGGKEELEDEIKDRMSYLKEDLMSKDLNKI